MRHIIKETFSPCSSVFAEMEPVQMAAFVLKIAVCGKTKKKMFWSSGFWIYVSPTVDIIDI